MQRKLDSIRFLRLGNRIRFLNPVEDSLGLMANCDLSKIRTVQQLEAFFECELSKLSENDPGSVDRLIRAILERQRDEILAKVK